MSWGQRAYAVTVLIAVVVFGTAAINDQRARTFERMHRRVAEAGARTTRSITAAEDAEESYFLALLGDFSGVAVTGVIGNGPDCTVDTSMLRSLRHYPELTTLRLRQAGLKSADFQQIFAMRSLIRLNLSLNELTDADLAGLENLEDLESLELQYTPLTDDSVPRLAMLSNLSKLDITGTDITPEGAERLRKEYAILQGAQAAQVVHRTAPSPRYRAAVIRLLPTNSYGTDTRSGSSRTRLHLRADAWKGHEQEIPLLAELSDVEAVNILGMPLSAALVNALVGLPKLQQLSISDLPGATHDLSKFSSCRNLRTLRLAGMQLDEGSLTSVAQLKSLETLSLFNCQLLPGACRPLADAQSVRSLHLRQIYAPRDEFNRLLSELECSPELRFLDLAAVRVAGESVPRLARLTQLVSLSLTSTGIDDAAVGNLCEFTHLQQLDISNTAITFPTRDIPISGTTQLEAALIPAGVRVVHTRSTTTTIPLSLAELAERAKAAATAKAPPAAAK